MPTDAQHHYETWPARVKTMRQEAPELLAAFGSMHHALMAEGALSVREKELIATAIGMAVHCDGCVYSHVKSAARAGATRAQLIEMAGVVVMMQGGPGTVQLATLMDAIDAVGVE